MRPVKRHPGHALLVTLFPNTEGRQKLVVLLLGERDRRRQVYMLSRHYVDATSGEGEVLTDTKIDSILEFIESI